MDKELVRAFILECKQEQEWKKRWRDNHIEFDNYFKYSGEIEKTQTKEFFERKSYGMFLEKSMDGVDEVVKYYFSHPELTLIDIGIKFNCSYKRVSDKISKYLKTRGKVPHKPN
tara:strand:+ start:74 stop:415 length:342 start_codon:yes stop_codon:yes gene_type:complete